MNRASRTASVVVAGSYNAGLTVYGGGLPAAGETVLAHRFEAGPGGKGANQAIGIARLGVDVAFATKLGDDVFGSQARATLVSEGLPPHGIMTGSGPTGVAVILVDTSGDNAISVAPGANLELTSRDVILALGDELEKCSYIVCQLECPSELAAGLAVWAREGGKGVVLNPAPARPIDRGDLHLFDVLTPNEVELATLARHLGVETARVETQALALVDWGVGTVVATLGAKGALRASVDGVERFPAYAVEVLDTTGAGDAFTAGLVAALARGSTMDDAIDAGCRSGAFCVTRRGVIDGLATSGELETAVPWDQARTTDGSP